MSLKDQLLELERGFWNAAGDRSFYDEHFADDGVAVFPMSDGILNFGKVRDSVDSGTPWGSVEFSNVNIIELDRHCAGLVYEALGKREGKPDYHALLTSVYRRKVDRWQLVIHQQTPLPD